MVSTAELFDIEVKNNISGLVGKTLKFNPPEHYINIQRGGLVKVLKADNKVANVEFLDKTIGNFMYSVPLSHLVKTKSS